MLLWDLEDDEDKEKFPNYMKAIRQPKELQKDITFNYIKLRKLYTNI